MRRSIFLKCGLTTVFLALACCLSSAQSPTISSISPNPVGIGQSVTISGTNFGTSGGVKFDGVTASTTSWSSTVIVATVPSGIATGNVAVFAGGHQSNSFPFTLNNGPVSYVYDTLGRLVGVIDVNGNAAEYSYDIVGNIQSISRFTATQVSIINFTPQSDPVSTSVTINGTGFSPTISQNTVEFNGTSAAVTSATNTQLQVTVPSSATTGPISVTSPHGSATSATNFTVTSSSGATTITSFTPSSGVAGTSVTIVGTNFNLTPSNDELRQNATPSAVSAATSTTLSTTVPATTASGYFTLLTPSGNAVSQDFYVPFGTHVPSNIGFTGRLPASGGSQYLTLNGQIALILFDATAGQKINISGTGTSFSQCDMYLIAPNNTTLASTGCNTNSSIESGTLLQTGTYTIGVDPGSTSGSITVSFSKDYTAQLTMPAPGTTGNVVVVPATGSMAVGQNALLTFDALASQKVSFNLPSFTNGYSCLFYLYSLNSSAPLTTNSCGSGAPSTYIDTLTLPYAETYSILIVPQGSATGSLSLSLNNDADVTTPAIAIGNAPAQWSAAVAGQDVRLTFTPNSSQTQIAIYLTNLSTAGNPNLNLVNPSGVTQASLPLYPSSQTFYMDTQPVTPNQPYQLWVQHYSNDLESQTIQIINVPANFTGTLSIPNAGTTGTAVQVPTTGSLSVGQNGVLTFSANAGQKVSFNVLGSTIGTSYASCNLTVMGPNPSTTSIASGFCGYQNSGYIDTVTIPTTGTYTVLIDPQGTATGSVSISINNDQDVTTPTISIGGGAVNAQTTVAGQDVRLSFTPTGSQSRIAVLSTNVTNPLAYLTLVTPAGSTQAIEQVGIDNNPSGQVFFLNTEAVTTNQQYQIWVQHSGTGYGKESILIDNVPADISHTIAVGGTAYTFSTVVGQNANIGFTISTSESVTVEWSSGTYPNSPTCNISVTGPSPSTNTVSYGSCNTATGSLLMNSLAAGTYNVLVDPQAQSSGGMTIQAVTP